MVDVEHRLYRRIEEKVAAVNAFLGEMESDPGRVRSLAGWGWIEDNVQLLPAHFVPPSK